MSRNVSVCECRFRNMNSDRRQTATLPRRAVEVDVAARRFADGADREGVSGERGSGHNGEANGRGKTLADNDNNNNNFNSDGEDGRDYSDVDSDGLKEMFADAVDDRVGMEEGDG